MGMQYLDVALFILLLVLGYSVLLLSRKAKLPAPILLFLLGASSKLFISDVDLMPFVVISLVFLVFDAGTRFIPRHFDNNSKMMLRFTIVSIIINSVFFGILLHYVLFHKWTVLSLAIPLLFGILLASCSQFEILKFFKAKKNRLFNITELEDHLSNPVVIVLAFFVFSSFLYLKDSGSIYDTLRNMLGVLLVDVATGVFFGLLMLYFAVRVMKRKGIDIASVLSSLLVYFVSVYYGGMGFIAVIISSMFFHNILSRKPDMTEFSPFINNLVYIFVFIVMGYVSLLNLNSFIASMMLFLLYLSLRHMVIRFTIRHPDIFLTLDCPKGLIVGAMACYIVLIGRAYVPIELEYLMYLLILVVMYSILLSYIVNVKTKDIII
jgi:NhaP-type Na+/H+ or K+/H+ antiporter